MKTIDTLVDDIQHVLKTGEGWTPEIAEWVAEDIQKSLTRQLTSDRKVRRTLRMSSLGNSCDRALWYDINHKITPEPIPPFAINKFIFGDIIESHLLGLCMAAGHTVEGMQDRVEIEGLIGHRDAIIDGWMVDVKSAATFSFDKFAINGLKGYEKTLRGGKKQWVPAHEADAFGYISQLSSYLYASQDDPNLVEKNKAAFLVMDKQLGKICLDVYDLTEEMKGKVEEVQRKKDLCCEDEPPARIDWGVVPDGKSGNMKLGTKCSYCKYKNECHPDLRTFLYSGGPRFLTKVVNEPKVLEVT